MLWERPAELPSDLTVQAAMHMLAKLLTVLRATKWVGSCPAINSCPINMLLGRACRGTTLYKLAPAHKLATPLALQMHVYTHAPFRSQHTDAL